MMASEKLAKCLKRLTKARDIARKCRKWLASSRCMDDMPAVKDGDTPFRTANVKPLTGEEDGTTLAPGTYTVPANKPQEKKDEK